MEKISYKAKVPDSNGWVDYSPAENAVWSKLYERQTALLQERACDEFIDGVQALKLNKYAVPQINDVSRVLRSLSGWAVKPVEALISFKDFFELLANRYFPAATFIRRIEDLDYLKEPDIFHEIFGHCSLLSNQAFADFTHRIGTLGINMSKEERVMLARLYWFTVEFGLMRTKHGLRIYGGGILSSQGESIYALDSDIPVREDFDLVRVLRTPYRYDEMQKKYFIINSFDQLFNLVNQDLRSVFKEAVAKGVITENDHEMRSC